MIRTATKKDALAAMTLLCEAMGDIAKILSGEECEEAILARLVEYCETPNSRLFYENISLYCDDDEILGAILTYKGRDAFRLDEVILDSLKSRGSAIKNIECECEAFDFYVDSLAVKESRRGEGIAQKLLLHAENLAQKSDAKWLALLVDCDKIRTKKYYEKLGFIEDSRRVIGADSYARMIKPL